MNKDIDILNVILIIVSLVLAFNLPFELFIFSYAFLGPLHYLTEINWLKEKNYFIAQTRWVWVFIFFAFLISLPVFLKLGVFSGIYEIPSIKNASDRLGNFTDEIVLSSLLFAIGLIYFKKNWHLGIFLICSVVVSLIFLNYAPDAALAITIFIPTLIHVYLFTLLFMIYGNLQSRSTAGVVGVVLLLLAPIIIVVSKINPSEYFVIPDFIRGSFDSSPFLNLNLGMAKPFITKGGEFNFFSILGIKIQIFIAFAYTYHYLNWFSKTSIIKWNRNLSKSKIIAILSIWILSMALYIYNFKIGFIVLSLLSLIHVFLEFPLNMTSIKLIVQNVKHLFVKHSA